MIRTLIQLLLKPFLAATFLYLCSLPENLYFDPPLWSYVVMFLVTLVGRLWQDHGLARLLTDLITDYPGCADAALSPAGPLSTMTHFLSHSGK
ncbi:hypothetical protein SJR98_18380 [Aeromonas hydrophila]|uniref:hypothetical protein n=1 Tax=Aeromonas hydrophila TaxID=644 RepID=UPI0029DAC6F7|nr:hypothetical protein [Aeromonas hydrophila]MDX7780051.1 hypothetical protein [Aeromonas hydrophila]